MSRPKVGSLFAGVGGFDMGLEAADFEVAWQVEIDKDAVSVLERHYPNVRRYRDVREVKGADLKPVDVLVGGFPCQDLSVAGARKGLAGERSGLFFEVARIAAETATPWLLLENVPGLLSSFTPVEPAPRDVPPGTEWTVEETSDIGVVLSTLAEHGYGFCTRTLDAQYLGVAQRRERVFIVGCLGDSGARAASVLLEPESVLRDLASCLASREGAPGVSPNGAGSGGVAGTLRSHTRPDSNDVGNVAYTLSATDGRRNAQGNAWNTTYIPTIGPIAGGVTARYGKGADSDVTDTLIVAAPLTAGSHPNSNMPGRHREDDVNLVAISQNQRGELRSSDVAPALGNGGGKPGQGYPAIAFTNRGETVEGAHETLRAASHGALPMVSDSWSVRRLMPVECERLMSWPDGWTQFRADGSLITDGPRYRLIGNGVVRNVSAWIGRRLYAALHAAAGDIGKEGR